MTPGLPQKILSAADSAKYKSFTLSNYQSLPQVAALSKEQRFAIEVVGRILPFKTNSYVVNELIDWQHAPDDPLFVLNFPQAEMLDSDHFNEMADLLRKEAGKDEVQACARRIREELNPNNAGQLTNRPALAGEILPGVQHKYDETVLFFPGHGQTCHAYCTYCFRWPQFVGASDQRFAMRETEKLIEYLKLHPEVSDLLITGGDPMVMRASTLASYLNPLLAADLPHLRSIRFGSKALSYWPHRFVSDGDADDLLAVFAKIVDSGRHLALMAHFNHPRELETPMVQAAISRIRGVGAQIRTQSPLLANINNDPDLWARMWQNQVELGCIPYYMFVARNTGANRYFSVPLARAGQVYKAAISQVSGLARTVRGPSMSANPGKVQMVGVSTVAGEKVFVLQMLQGRNSEWVGQPFFAAYDEEAVWLNDLKPAFGADRFFYEDELAEMGRQ